ncbi:hypothetical protein BFW01_g408 [Lasiodiplodia theobromae]|uniref:PD-(D/E)XK nuclease-like domain-containing protein n=1 Tax=Lasiodiplodia theobromae TaxID=45133 RepID=A0A8H7IRY5_9PEZI|nr:hypothetical protein BFW01_g408 [Lasiodiplodia theobromae]
MVDLREVSFTTVAKTCEVLGGELEELLEKLVDIKTSVALVPRAMKPHVEKSDFKYQVRDYHYEVEPTAPPNKYEVKRKFDHMAEIIEATVEYRMHGTVHEDQWNAGVHFPVLKMVAESKMTREVFSIKSVEIEPSIFLYAPAQPTAEEVGNTSIDFGVVLKPSGELQKSIKTGGRVDKNRNNGVVEANTANPTYYELLRQNPIFVPVETMPIDGDYADGKLQLVKWSKAIIGKLRSMKDSAVEERASKMTEKPTEEEAEKMTRKAAEEGDEKASGNGSTPTENPTQDDTQESKSYSSGLPVCVGILIQAERWEVMFLKMHDDGKWTLVSGVDIGGTLQFVDFCKLLKCLDLIYESREGAFFDFYMALGQILAV